MRFGSGSLRACERPSVGLIPGILAQATVKGIGSLVEPRTKLQRHVVCTVSRLLQQNARSNVLAFPSRSGRRSSGSLTNSACITNQPNGAKYTATVRDSSIIDSTRTTSSSRMRSLDSFAGGV
ncbi:uncharacterized protein PV07_02845 [Cladophialophora immunda]|uniref:Uncharacterized protein n=1 Tax=Cladophialophora immunda TaxID=569365 RepID=A0A0D2B0Q9_9EURO|nr:uncharacterized protein PV07_02845 [Cladophialophora immunda]KIW31177.1 hypothetical protein PV07_02845 [Cladophialophora immunda]